MIAGLEQIQYCIGGSETTGKTESVPCPLQRRQIFLKSCSGRVTGTGVLEALVLSGRFLLVGRGEINRGHDGPRYRVRFLTGMNGTRLESHLRTFFR